MGACGAHILYSFTLQLYTAVLRLYAGQSERHVLRDTLARARHVVLALSFVVGVARWCAPWGAGGLRMGMLRGLGLSVGAPREARARAETGCVRAQRAAKKMYAEASGQILPLIY